VDIHDPLIEAGQQKEQWRTDVVREVADDALSLAQARVVELERVGNMQDEFGGSESPGKPRRQITVDLDRRQATCPRDQRCRQRRKAGADLDEVVTGYRCDRIDNPGDVVRISEEILAEALAGGMPLHRLQRAAACAASSIASSTAAMRLPGSAARAFAGSPARSSAVP
jgi:hypothetical protein